MVVDELCSCGSVLNVELRNPGEVHAQRFVDERANLFSTLTNEMFSQVVVEEAVFSLRFKHPLVGDCLGSARDEFDTISICRFGEFLILRS